MADALSIEQNNKIRVALGLKPLPVPGANTATSSLQFKESSKGSSDEDEHGSTLESRQARAGENWKRLQDDAESKRRREAKHAAIRKARELVQRNQKLEGKGLGDTNTELDTKSWLIQHKKLSKKVEKERSRRLAEELAERDRVAVYTAADLAGIKVGHELEDFESNEQILTLKDANVDDEEDEDELENIDLREKEKLNDRLDLKKKRLAYDPTEADGTENILAQYDEEIDGKKRKHFTLDRQGSTIHEREAKRQNVSDLVKKQVVNLDIFTEAPVSDYMDAIEVKIKKPKKKKSKTTRQKIVDDDDIFPIEDSTNIPNGEAMDIDSVDGASKVSRKKTESSFVDDEDLQASLSLQRRAAFKTRKKLRPEDIARQLREEGSQTPVEIDHDEDGEDGSGLVIDETSEFVSNLQRPTVPEKRERPNPQLDDKAVTMKRESPGEPTDEDVDMGRSYNDIEDEEDLKERTKVEEAAEESKISGTGLDEEAILDQGLGATLSLLRQRGLVQQSDAADKNSLFRDRQLFLQGKQRREEDAEKRARSQRERDRTTGKLDRMSAREREEYARWENKQRDQQESRQMVDIFNREYKPDVQLKYVDDHGRLMNQKEAFKHLSHQFHGKGSGKMKTEKHLKKIEEEKKREAMSALQSSQDTTMNNAMGATARKNRQAGVRLA